MMDQEARQVAESYLQAMQSQSPTQLLALCGDNVEYTGIFVRKLMSEESGTVKGKEALRGFLQKMMPEFEGAKLQRIGCGNSSVVIEMTLPSMLPFFIFVGLNSEKKIAQVTVHQEIP